MINSLTLGFVPAGWGKNQEGEPTVEIGNPEFSIVNEISFQIEQNTSSLDFDDMRIGSQIYLDLRAIKKFSAFIEEKIGCKVDSDLLRLVMDCYVTGDLDALTNNSLVRLISTDSVELVVDKKMKDILYVHGHDEKSEHDYLSVINSKPKK